MDTIVVLGNQEEKLVKFLSKMGQRVITIKNEQEFKEIINNEVIDCVFIDEEGEVKTCCYIQLLASLKRTKDIPIVLCAVTDHAKQVLKEYDSNRSFLVPAPCSVGTVVAKIATVLRLRKIAGADESTASLSEINARLRDLNKHFEDDLKEAEVIQRSLIPAALPQDDRYSMAVTYVPLEGVGGDWYYVEKYSDGKIAIHIADVTGHGLPAAFIAAMTKLAMTAAGELSPEKVLTEMNRLMTPNIPDGRFVTILSCLYDPSNGELVYARGGHPVGLHLSQASHRVNELKEGGFALGFMDNTEYELGRAQLDVGDVLLVYTDAILESKNLSGEMYEQGRLNDSLLKTVDVPDAEGILVSIQKDFDAFREERIVKDDVTIIALKRLA